MHHVELLPSTTTHVTPGWTYVPDRGFDPAKAAITPAIGRKRGIRDPGRADLTSRQSNAIVRHLAELDRENHRDTQISIPVKQKDASGRGTRGKVTSNVRRILQSQKTFRNYLDDEEASLAQQATTQAQQTTSHHRPSIHKITKPTSASSRRSSTPLTITTTAAAVSKPDTSRQRKPPSIAPTSSRASTVTTPAETTEPEPETQTPAPDKEDASENTTDLIKSEHDNDPLLRCYIPSAPSDRIMQALIAEPPLTYNASRAGPPITRKSPRYFCCMCGYWGKIRCKNCHLRTCGLDCYKVHEDSRCGAFF
ncbi:putative HIT finger domain protein [Aspergillus sclerotiicarbonarius CBS 121057]|uniref:Putative HIT finger domain protein n=1 Tax=Aspergillus sclerotiicarbonarius (strain CBS 121057 / IBT 28362) TaxID=1448318 RepID=A0A319ER23_ASPSB|nr:putative HIT finger domain protein [Aspergillus sclerotiicarbonarius CBS 121057]